MKKNGRKSWFMPWIIKLPGLASYLFLSISLPTCESGIRRVKYLSAAIFKKAVHSDDP